MSKRKKVLIIDDDAENSDFLIALLGFETYDTRVCLPSKGCMDRITRIDPDLILLNAVLKTVDSRDVCKLLKTVPAVAGIPVVFVNGSDIRKEVESAVNAGADEYLNRWVGPRMLSKTVETLLSFDDMLKTGVESSSQTA